MLMGPMLHIKGREKAPGGGSARGFRERILILDPEIVVEESWPATTSQNDADSTKQEWAQTCLNSSEFNSEENEASL